MAGLPHVVTADTPTLSVCPRTLNLLVVVSPLWYDGPVLLHD